MTRELAILLVQTRQILIYVALIVVFAILVDAFIKPKKMKRKFIGWGIVAVTAIFRIMIELYLGLAIYEAIVVLVLSLIAPLLILVFLDY